MNIARRSALYIAGPLGLLIISPSTALASDFGGIVEVFLLIVAGAIGGALLLAAATEAILVTLFAVVWLAVIWGAFQLWLQMQPRLSVVNPPPAVQNSIQEKAKQADAPPPPP